MHVTQGQRLFGGSGRDNLFAYAHTTDAAIESQLDGDQLFGGTGGDFLFGNIRREVLVGETGNDFIAGDLVLGPRYIDNPLADVVGANDLILGGSGEDQLLGGGGDDTIWAGADSDWIQGQNGNDTTYGGSGIDITVLDIGAADENGDFFFYDKLGDTIDGHFGNEPGQTSPDDNATDILLIEGTSGNDEIFLSQGPNDKLKVSFNGQEILADWRAADGTPLIEQFRVSGLLGDDKIGFVRGDDALDIDDLIARSRDFIGVIDGGTGNDTLVGTDGRDRLDGGRGSDVMFGFAGDDRLWGDGGSGFDGDHDVLFAGQGNDDLVGGLGSNDLYAWSLDPRSDVLDPFIPLVLDRQDAVTEFGIFVDENGNLVDNDGDLDNDGFLDVDGTSDPYSREDTGLNRMLGSSNNDRLHGGTELDFMFGNGGDDQLFRVDGSSFESLDGGLAGDAWKEYAKSTNRVWYVGATNADDVICTRLRYRTGLTPRSPPGHPPHE